MGIGGAMAACPAGDRNIVGSSPSGALLIPPRPLSREAECVG